MKKQQRCRIDPDPFTVIGAVSGVVGAAFGGLALLKRSAPDVPHRFRRKALNLTSEIEDEVRYLRSDMDAIEALFQRADFTGDRHVRLGNGVLMTSADFEAYARASDSVFVRLRSINKLTLSLERHIAQVTWLDHRVVGQHVGRTIDNLQEVLIQRNLSVERAWGLIREAMQEVEALCRSIREQFE